MTFTPTKKLVKRFVNEFMETKSPIYSSVKRGTSAVEDKVVDIMFEQVIRISPQNESEMKTIVDELMRGAIEQADMCGFVKIIYDFVLISASDYEER